MPAAPDLTPEEAARLAAFDAVVKMRDEQWRAMMPQEKTEELQAWEQVKKSVNENRAGFRQVFVNQCKDVIHFLDAP